MKAEQVVDTYKKTGTLIATTVPMTKQQIANNLSAYINKKIGQFCHENRCKVDVVVKDGKVEIKINPL